MTSVHYPPTLVASPHTPAEEWAQQTTSVVANVGDERHPNEEPPEVPRSELMSETGNIPGGYPGLISDHDAERLKESTKEALASAQKTAQGVYQKAEQTAKEYIPVAQRTVNEKAQTVYETAEQAARQYLPQSVVGKLEQVGVLAASPVSGTAEHDQDTRPAPYTSMPTDEVGPFRPTHAGVGTLPGQPTEEGVAKLPDQRLEELREQLPTRETQTGPSRGGVGSLPGRNSETSVAKLPDQRLEELREQLPTHETQTGPSRGGVGSLPGSNSETGVAELPEERLQDQVRSSRTANDDQFQRLRNELPSRGTDTGPTHGAGTLPGGRNESGVAILPEERNTENKEFRRTIVQEPVTVGGVATGVAGSTAVKADEKSQSASKTRHVPVDDNNINVITGQETRGTGAGLHSVEPTRGSPPGVGSEADNLDSTTSGVHDKVSLTTKLKANAKIIGGKISRDKELVEEGKSMKTSN